MYPILLTMGAGDREAGIIRLVDWDTQKTISESEYRSDLSCFMEGREKPRGMTPRCKLNGGTFHGELFYTCTYNEILVYTFNQGFELVRTISRPTFADLHHVYCNGERLWVVCTGLDIVEELDLDGNLINQYQVADDVTDRYDLTQDYRRVAETKPHTSHPSYINEVDGRFLVTLQRKRSVIDLHTGETVFDGFPGPIHDGSTHGEHLYYTSVNGHVIRTNPQFDAVESFDTFALFGRRNPGWCRGLCVTNNGHVLVGYTRSRQTHSPGFKKNIAQRTYSYLKEQFKNRLGRPAYTTYPKMDSHLAEIDLSTNRLIKDYPLGGRSMTIYGIYELTGEWSELVQPAYVH